MARASFGGATITARAPSACARRLKATATSVPGALVPTHTGMRPATASTVFSTTVSRSRSVSLSASPSTPRIVMPCTPRPTVNSARRAMPPSSSVPSARNGVGVML